MTGCLRSVVLRASAAITTALARAAHASARVTMRLAGEASGSWPQPAWAARGRWEGDADDALGEQDRGIPERPHGGALR